MEAKRTTTLPRRIGQALRQRRDALHLSQEELAERAGMDRINCSNIERGTKRIRVDTLERVALALGVRPWEVLRDAEQF